MYGHNNSRGNSHWNGGRNRHSSQGYNQDRGRLRYRREENSHRSQSHHGRSRSHLNVNGKRSRSNDAKGSNQVRALSEHRFENHSRGNGIRWEPPSSSRRQQHSPALEDGDIEERGIMMEQHKEHPMTNSSNMQLHSNEMQLSSRKDRPRYDRPQQKQHPHNRQHYDHRMLQQQSWYDRPQQKQHPHNRQHYDHRMLQQPSRNDRPQQKQHPHNRQHYDHHMPQQPSRNDRQMIMFKDARTAIELVQMAEQMKFRNLPKFWNSMSKQIVKRQPRDDRHQDSREMNRMLSQIFEITQREVPSYQSRDLSLTIHGIAKITCMLKEGGSTRNRNCVEAALHSLLLDNAIRRGLFDTMANQIVALENLTSFSSQSLANIVWAFAKVELPHQELFDKVAHHIASLQRLHEFNHQGIANTVWAYAKAGVSHQELFDKVARHIASLQSLDEFRPQEIANTVWAYATAGVSHQELFDKVARHIASVQSLDEFRPQEIANTVWAYAKAGIAHEALFDKIARHIVSLQTLDEFKPREIANTVWAFANANIPFHEPVFDKISDFIIANNS